MNIFIKKGAIGVIWVLNEEQNVPNNSSVYCKKDNIKNSQEGTLVLRQVF